MDNKDLYMYREKSMEFVSLHNYNNEYNLVNTKTDGSSSIWRYMNLSKFLSLIDSQVLYLSKPQYFRDPFEGAFSERDLIHLLGEPPTYIPDILMDYNPQREELIKKNKTLLQYVGVSCWHMNDVESAAMWDLYLSSSEGLAIKTTIDSLYDSVQPHKNVYIGKVQYIDYNKDMASKNIFETLFYKRKSFEHEHEVRLIALEDDENPSFDKAGVELSVDLNRLIEEIYIHPNAPKWFFKAVEGLLLTYEIKKPLKQSTLYTSPSMVW
ncbi:DUF2971 domain-containing protein [Lysinibacillus sp. FJAT-14745]|uniref:DUF2971 domain-containing protein n=1 Tax=Lysinibacillus sp. FJAT-14745 TaxID=1704289 RepID=UPI0006AB9254|nr:DUF2971 domain-containing protein [Lysinibacillus sp. FJAT-14745]